MSEPLIGWLSSTTSWVVLGVLLLVTEMLSGKLVLIFFALGAFVTSLLHASGVASIPIEIIFFSAISVAGLFFLRKPVMKRFVSKAVVDIDVGQSVTLDQAIGPHQSGYVHYQGVPWQARNTSTANLSPGDSAVIVGREGNQILIKKI